MRANPVAPTMTSSSAIASAVAIDHPVDSLSYSLRDACVMEKMEEEGAVGAGSPLAVFPSAAAEEAAVLAALRAEKEQKAFLSSGDEGVDVLGHINKAPSLNVLQ